LEAAKTLFDEQVAAADAQLTAVTSRGAVLGNNYNRTRYGVGAQYRQQINEFDAQLARDRAVRGALGGLQLSYDNDVNQRERALGQLPAGDTEERATAEKNLAAARAASVANMEKYNTLAASINARTQEGTDAVGTLRDRLLDAGGAWANNSGIMDDWKVTLENNIGPALELFTNQLSAMFEALLSGSRSFKHALGDMMKAFAQFVLQIITKALALMAIKAILGAFGLELGTVDGGTIIRSKGSFKGGPVEAPGKYAGGYIDRGFRTHDSALYNLARGEYVVNNKSVEDLGLPFMEQINKHGRKGLDKVAGRGGFLNMQAPRQETNVYVVQEKQLPPMTPSDVLVTVAADIMQNGPTKKLIKSVAQGG
jgi:hypothetical protein